MGWLPLFPWLPVTKYIFFLIGLSADGYLAKAGDVADQEWTVVKKYNMPDLQPGVKLQRTK